MKKFAIQFLLRWGARGVAVLMIPVVVMLVVIRPLICIRFGVLISDRIGHFVLNTELHECRRDADRIVSGRRTFDVWTLATKQGTFTPLVCNQQVLTMWRRVICIWPVWCVDPILKATEWVPSGHRHRLDGGSDRDVDNYLEKTTPHLKFTEEELAHGECLLLDLYGVEPKDTVVCLMVRDSAYLNLIQPETDWNYHNYRDQCIEDYVEAAQFLASKNCYVFRMGTTVKQPFECGTDKVIDYANDPQRTAFLDVYLAWRCLFAISSSCGWDALPCAFRKPFIQINYAPLGYLATWFEHSLATLREHRDGPQGRALGSTEIVACGAATAVTSDDFAAGGITLVSNTPQEIRDVTEEMWERLHGLWEDTEEDEQRQQRFWEQYPMDLITEHSGGPAHGVRRMRIGAKFLRNHPEWWDLSGS
jgi:putative glycosyltransferase (TIGR04372 family)